MQALVEKGHPAVLRVGYFMGGVSAVLQDCHKQQRVAIAGPVLTRVH